jgi:hypothetical protein
MIIEINTNILEEFGITADDFLYLYLLHAKSYDCLEQLTLKPNTEALQTKGLIKLGEELEDHIVRQTFLDMFQASFDQMWAELLSHFPLKVFNNGHLRVLRAKDANAKANAKARERYRKIVGEDLPKHQFIVKCLVNELELRKSTNTLGYMQMLSTWVNNYTWEKYEDIETNSPNDTRITRQL